MKLLGLGDNTVDTYVDRGLQFPGGNAVNVAVLAARLGASAAYLGCLGDDDAGDLLFTALTAENIDLSHSRRRAGANARALIGHRDGDRFFIGSTPGVRAQYDLGPPDFAYIAEFDVVHTSIYSDLGAILPAVKAASARLSFDFSERWTPEALAGALPHVDIAFLSFPKGDDRACETLLRECAAQGPQIVLATRGDRGAMALAKERLITQGVAPATIVDTLGAGDGFIAAFLVAHLSGAGMRDALQAGAVMAAQCCAHHGAFGHAAPWSESMDVRFSATGFQKSGAVA